MQGEDLLGVNRRDFLSAGAVGAAALAGTSASAQEPKAAAAKATLPTRKLGRSGIEVTILNQGTHRASGLERILRVGYAGGIRYFDTAQSYGSEPDIRAWLRKNPAVRKEIFLATKDHPSTPKQLIPMLDARLQALGTDYLDLIFIHALGDDDPQQGLDWPKSREFKETVEAIKKSGKAKLVGFSTHHKDRAAFLRSAAEGGFVDVIMLKFSPWLDKESPLNRAIDACHKAGIGLVSMKQIAGQGVGDFPGDNTSLQEVAKRMPETLEERELSPYQGLLQAIWSDERISSACVSMRNTDQLRENIAAARGYKPIARADIEGLRDAFLAAGPMMCADCDGRCAAAGKTAARLGDLARYLTYHEHHGDRSRARADYAALTDEERDWRGADLEAARAACPSGLDFARLLPRADERLA